MKHALRRTLIILLTLAVAVYFMMPPDKKLRRGKDLAGGASLVYQVAVPAGENPRDLLDRVISVLKSRVDPTGVLEITMVAQGSDRIEISMPLPSEQVKGLRKVVEEELAKLAERELSEDELARLFATAEPERTAWAGRVAAGDPEELARLTAAIAAYDESAAAQNAFREVAPGLEAAVEEARLRLEAAQAEAAGEGREQRITEAQGALNAANAALDGAADAPAAKQIGFEKARAALAQASASSAEVRRVLQLSNQPRRIRERSGGPVVEEPSPRAQGLDRLRTAHPGVVAQLDKVVSAWNAYEAERETLDDPQDLIRMLKGAGVLNFRICVNRGEHPEEAQLRQALRRQGPANTKASDPTRQARWYKINKLENWFKTLDEYRAMMADPGQFFGRMSYVAEAYDGEIWMLLWDTPDFRLTQADGEWGLTRAGPTVDQYGRRAVNFEMNPLGAARLSRLTENNVGKQMAVLLDDEVYTAPTLNAKLSRSAVIEGSFSEAEVAYLIRVLAAGSLAAKLSPEPISMDVLGPQLGADNLSRGLKAGMICFALTASFMAVYYFGYGLISVMALVVNSVLILGAMAMNHAAFTLPGIAGVILTFSMAVDANVLVYERMREEILKGADLRTAVRLGYSRALAAIVDGNLTNLIVCVVLGFTGTQEIKGFAITMSIGVLTTLFAQLFVTRYIFDVLVEKVHVRKMRMLPLAVPALGRLLTPKVDWLRLTPVYVVVSSTVIGVGVAAVIYKGSSLLSIEFRGGSAATIQLRADPADASGKRRLVLTRQDIEDRLDAAAEDPANAALLEMRNATILVVNPSPENAAASSEFTIKTTLTDAAAVQRFVVATLGDVIDSRPALSFEGSGEREARLWPVQPVLSASLGDAIGRPDDRRSTAEFIGGAAVLLSGITPQVSLESLTERLTAMRSQADYSDTAGRKSKLVILEGSEDAVRSAVLLSADPDANYFDDAQRWQTLMRDREWSLVTQSLTSTSTLASVQSFSPAVASTFTAQAVVAILLSTVLIIIYVWARFAAVRYSLAAIVATLHDCVVAVGALAVCNVIYDWMPGFSQRIGLLPFTIDLTAIASVLTILGYSINDTIVVLDRIREMRGKLPHASRGLVNAAINETFSRTLMTGGTTLLSTIVLYALGGEGVRAFAFTLFVGIVTGTYSSIAIGGPIVCSRWAKDETRRDAPLGGMVAPA